MPCASKRTVSRISLNERPSSWRWRWRRIFIFVLESIDEKIVILRKKDRVGVARRLACEPMRVVLVTGRYLELIALFETTTEWMGIEANQARREVIREIVRHR